MNLLVLAVLVACTSVQEVPVGIDVSPVQIVPTIDETEEPPISTISGTPTAEGGFIDPTDTGDPGMTPTPEGYEIVAYFPEWRASSGYLVKSIVDAGSAGKITVINYAFGIPQPDPVSGEVVCGFDNPRAAYAQTYSAAMSVDGEADALDQPLRGHFNQLRKLKARYPQIRVVVSLGGWTGSGWFSVAARDAEARRKFVASCLDIYLHGNLPALNGAGGEGTAAGVFDGIDIDWEYPVGGGLPDNHTHPDDAANFVLLLREFREQYAAAGRPDFMLTMAAPGPSQADQYNMAEAHPYLDYVAIMGYDFRGGWSDSTGHHTNLCASDYDPAPPERRISGDGAVRGYRDHHGVPASKLVLGGAFYGRAWSGVPDVNHGLFQPGKAASEGEGSYPRLVQRMEQGYMRYWDETAQAPYLYNAAEQTFWTYDDPQSLRLKASYARSHGLGGMMFWEISEDDAQGSLVDAIYQELSSKAPPTDPCGGTQ